MFFSSGLTLKFSEYNRLVLFLINIFYNVVKLNNSILFIIANLAFRKAFCFFFQAEAAFSYERQCKYPPPPVLLEPTATRSEAPSSPRNMTPVFELFQRFNNMWVGAPTLLEY